VIIQINADHNIECHEKLSDHIRGVVEYALKHCSDHITRVEVHLTDEASQKDSQNDKRCMMEARLEGRPPIAVTHHASSVEQAIEGAAHKLTRLVESTLDRQHDQRLHRTDPFPPETKLADKS
jgi:ribosome-associated translation inhibitor RaiA